MASLFKQIRIILNLSSLGIVHVKFLDDPRSILDHLLVCRSAVVSEGVNHLADAHVLEGFAALFVHAEIADRKQCDATRRLGRTFVGLNDFKQLLQSAVLDEVFAQSV